MPDNNLSKIENEPNLRKDPRTGVVVNVSSDEYNKYIKRKQIVKSENEKINKVENELAEVKDLLRSVLDKLSND